MNSEIGNGHEEKVIGGVQKKSGNTHRKSLKDSLDGELRGFLTDEGQLHTYDDLTKVNPVTPTTVLKCLQARYRAQVFYTHAGCTLVALNPFQPIPGLYSQDVMKQYHCAPQPQESKPHIFIVAEEAYRNVQGQVDPVNQSQVVSGESGAGKTWTSRCLMRYYATVAASSSLMKSQNTVERIERRVLDSNPIMEAFGNACTLRNSNSSRFGRYIQLQLDRSQLLVGASVQTYLLEKTRVASQPTNERNFHIFYQMTKGASGDQRKDWKMLHDQTFAWLPNAEKTLEEDCFDETVEAMVHLGLDAEKQGHIFRILAGLLHLGNITFCSATDESQPCDFEEHSEDFVHNCASLLGVPGQELQTYLRVQTLRAGKQSVLFRPCSLADCSVRRDCLAKVVYAQLFEWLVAFINNSMCAKKSTWCNFIGLLDVYGFECFQVNSLEQLCINYANEKLQQHFVAHYLKAQQEEYISEGLEWSFVQYQDNQGCLDLIEGTPTGVFSLLNEECRLNRASDAKQFRTRLETELSDHGSVSWDKFSTLPHFTVAHYAGKVSYQIEGMMEKNKDPVPPELISLVQKSQNPQLHQMFADRQAEDQGTRGLRQVVTVVSKFKNSLECLMKILHSTTPHYIRCIKPNAECRPLTFKKEEVILQLEACGIVETIHISAAGFPIRIPYWSFIQRYGLMSNLTGVSQGPGENGLAADGTDALAPAVTAVLNAALRSHPLDSSDDVASDRGSALVHCGRTKVFLTNSMLELLEEHRTRARSQRAFTIQCCWHRHQQRRRLARRRAAVLIQAVVRSWLVRRGVLSWNQAATVIQRSWRKWRALMNTLAEAELDDAEDLPEEEELDPILRATGSVQLQSLSEPVMVHGWPMGLALASAPTITVYMTATGFQKVMSALVCLSAHHFRSGEYQVETNQFKQGVASIRALPRGSIRLHYQRSPLLYADRCPEHNRDRVTGLNQILLEGTGVG
ncbi:hypothetical protein DPEC_G00228450 [Dallia pectoralis]|uniref:Uncharacterized protein n=1 Tax=Dallia pectoralis TaxID=75939 RepID=A0ACC2G1E2_DALPE|nr:hypothetical protein DPEC_G00228450 [Dallia pectoralis]